MVTCRSVGIRILSEHRVVLLLGFLALPVLLSPSCAKTKARNRTADPWTVLKGYNLSSVVWSPNGKRIAFVAANYKDNADDGLLRASIWLASAPEQGRTAKPRRLAVLTRKQGIPVALFWLDSNRIGWAASCYAERAHNFRFVQMGLRERKPKFLVGQTFSGIQNRLSMESGFGGPDDVYYDAESKTLLFSGGVMPSGVYIKTLAVPAAGTRKLSVPGADEAAPVTLCGSLRDPQRPEFYTAAVVHGSSFEWRIWLSRSYSLRQDELLVTSPERYLLFPRASPDGKKLVYLMVTSSTGRSEMVLHDLGSGTDVTLAKLSSQWQEMDPAMGCPFSWSPDGKMIAYADGSEIRIVKVAH